MRAPRNQSWKLATASCSLGEQLRPWRRAGPVQEYLLDAETRNPRADVRRNEVF